MKAEVDHRVMNSLQFVSSLLQLQSRHGASTETRQQLLAAAHRVRAVARTHRVFSADETRDRLPIVPHLRELCGELAGILDAEIGVVGAPETSVPKDQVLAIGLIVNELAANARKHGAGRITVSFGLSRGRARARRVRRGPWPAGRILDGWTGRARARHEGGARPGGAAQGPALDTAPAGWRGHVCCGVVSGGLSTSR